MENRQKQLHFFGNLNLTVLHDKQEKGQGNKHLPHIGKLGSDQDLSLFMRRDFNQCTDIIYQSSNTEKNQIGMLLSSPIY